MRVTVGTQQTFLQGSQSEEREFNWLARFLAKLSTMEFVTSGLSQW